MDQSQALWKASGVFAPDYPRRCTNGSTMQSWQDSRGDLVVALEEARENNMPGFYSVYSFPRKHPQNGGVPRIDCIFIDLDVTGQMYDPERPVFADWRADMSSLLARSRMIADAIIEADMEDHFRVVLSGHKGIHLYLDFEPLSPAEGNSEVSMFKAGLYDYGEAIMEWLDGLAGGINIQPWVDVDGSDLARLARHPNTIHHGAVYDNTTRWAVPVTVEELASLHWDDYLDYTDSPRWPDIERVPSKSAHKKAALKVRNANPSGSSSGSAQRKSSVNKALSSYKAREKNNDITLEDVLFLTENKPCFQAFRERKDAFKHGDASRTMELSIMGRLLAMNVPVDVIHEFFEPIPGYDEDYTDEIIGDLLARGNEYGEFNCNTVCEQSPQFCLGDNCDLYRRSNDIQK